MRTSIILKVTFVTTLGSSTWIATAQQVEDQWWIPNSTVHAVARDTATGTIYLGGEFTSVAAPVRFGAALDPTTAAPEVFWAMPNGAVYESIPDGAGGWYICGAFTQVGSSPRVGVARLNSDGSVHPFVCDITGQVLELAQSNDTLYLGGTFTSNVLTSQRNYMAVNANTGAMFPMFPGGVNGTVRALEIAGNTVYAGGDFSQPNGDGPYSSTIDLSTGATDAPGVKANANVMCSAPDGAGGWYIGGQFTLVGGVARGRAARINADGTLHPWDPNVAGGDVRAIRVIGSEVYLGGNFLTVGGQVRGGMAAVDATTGALLPFFDNMAISPISASSYILDFEQNGNDLIAGGQFSFLGGAKQYGVKLDATSSAPDFGYLVPNGIVYAAASDGAGGWYIGGAFTSVGGTTRNRLARINADGTLNVWNPNSNNTVYSLAFSGGNVYAGGVFTSVGGQTRRLIAALDGTTGLVTAFDAGNLSGSAVYALHLDGAQLHVGGQFNDMGGSGRQNLCMVDATTGNAMAASRYAVDNTVYSFARNGSTVYAGGAFTTTGLDRPNGAVLDPITAVPDFSTPEINNQVLAAIPDGSGGWYIGGSFNMVGGVTRNRIARINADGSLNAWNPNAGGGTGVYSLKLVGTTLYVGGDFTSIGGQTRNSIAAFDATTGVVTGWNPDLNGNVKSIEHDGTLVYAGGAFTTVGGRPHSYLVALDPITGDKEVRPTANQLVNTLKFEGGSLYAGGNFSSVGKSTPYVALMTNASDTIANNTVRPNGDVFCSAPDGAGGWYIGGIFTTVGGVSRNRLARINADGTLHAWNPSANGSVSSLTVDDGIVYVGGAFTSVGGSTRNFVAALDATTGLATTWNPGANGNVRSIRIAGSDVLIGGEFTSTGGASRNRLAAIDISTGVATTWNPNVNNAVYELELSGTGTVYIIGQFSTVGGQARAGLAEVDLGTGLLTAWVTTAASGGFAALCLKVYDANSLFVGGQFPGGAKKVDRATGATLAWDPALAGPVTIWDIQIDGGTIYLGGAFTAVGSSPRLCIAALDAGTASANGWQPNIYAINSWVRTISLNGDQVFAGGQFTVGNALLRQGVAEWATGSGTWTNFDPAPSDQIVGVTAIEATSTHVYIGGNFAQMGGQSRNRLAEVDRITGLATSWNPAPSDVVYGLGLKGPSALFVAGKFTSIGGSGRVHAAEFSIPGGMLTPWNVGLPSGGFTEANCVTYDGAQVFLGGRWQWMQAATRNRLMAYDAGTGDRSTWNPNANNTVSALAFGGGNVYAGGAFTTVGGGSRARLAALDASTGLATAWAPDPDATVNALHMNGTTLYAGGAFTTASGEERQKLAAYDIASGLLTNWDPGADATVRCFATHGSGVYVGGDFRLINGWSRTNLCAIDRTSSIVSPWTANTNGYVYSLQLDGGLLYTGGAFTTVAGLSRSGLAAVDIGTGVPNAWAPAATGGAVLRMKKVGSTVYVGGQFTALAGQARNRFGAVDATTGVATSLNLSITGSLVRAIDVDGTDLHVGGIFSQVLGSPRSNAAAIDLNTSTLLSFDPNPSGDIMSVQVVGGKIFYVGFFTNIGGPLRPRIASWNTTTGVLNAFNPAPNGFIHDLKWDNGTLYCAGQFTTLASTSRNNIGAVNASTGAITSLNPNANSVVYRIGISGTSLYALGAFTFIGGQARRVAEFNLNTGLITTWNPSFTGSTLSNLEVTASSVFVAGSFSVLGGQSRAHLAELDRTSGLATAWNPGPNAQCHTIANDGTHIYAGGNFTTIGARPRSRLCALDVNGQLTAWNPGANNNVLALALDANNVYAGGLFTIAGTASRGRIAAISKTTGVATGWNPNANGVQLQTIAVDGSIIYAGGDFTTIGGQARNRIAALDASTGSATAWNPNANASPNAILPIGNNVYVSGTFTTIGGQTRNRIAALDATTGLATAWDPNANTEVHGMRASGNTLYVAGFFTNIGGQVRDRVAALDLATGLATAWDPNADAPCLSIDVIGSKAVVGGTFTSVGGDTRARLAVLDTGTGSSSGWDVGPVTGFGVNSVVTDGLRVYAGGNFTAFGGSGHNYFAVAGLCPNPLTYYYDADADGLGDASMDSTSCDQPVGYVLDDTDDCPLAVDGIANFDTNTCNCDLGYFQTTAMIGLNAVITNCTICPPGSFCPDGVDAFECPAGYFNSDPGQAECAPCLAGTYQDQTGQVACTLCPVDTYNPSVAQTACLACPEGESSGEGATACTFDPTCTTNLSLDVSLPSFAIVGPSFQVRRVADDMVIESGGGGFMNQGVTSLTFCLPDGAFYLVMTGMPVNGKYVLRTAGNPGTRIIDNKSTTANGQVTEFNVAPPALSSNGALQIPVGLTEFLYTSCDKYFWKKGEFIVVNEDADVAAEWVPGGGTAGQSSTTGYDFWFYDPNGGYSFIRQRRHNVSDGFGNVGSARTCHMQVNNWAAANWIPNQLPLNVRVRAVVNNVPKNWGPACRFVRDDALALCPPTKLMDVPGNPFISCNVFRDFNNQSINRLYARPVSGATKYRFTFNSAELGGSPIVREVTTYYLTLGWGAGVAPPLNPGEDYDVTVQAFKGGVWCTAGETCKVTINNAVNGGQQNSALETRGDAALKLWPNPNRGDLLNVSLLVPEELSTITMDIFDLSGTRVITRTIAAQEGVVNTGVAMDRELAAGMYIVNITAGDRTWSDRIVMQP